MTKTNVSRLPKEHPAHSMTRRVAGGIGVAVLLLLSGLAVAQEAAPATTTPANPPAAAQPVVQNGFVVHQTVDLGGHLAEIAGSGNGTVEILYDDNAFTPVSPRQTKIYRVHSLYRPKNWASVTTSYLDTERHDNTNNTGVTPIDGPLQHVDHSRVASVSTDLSPSEHYGFDFSYAYSDVYTSTNICYLNGATATLPGTASVNSAGAANVCPGVFARGSTTVLSDWGPSKDFMDAPTQSCWGRA